MMLGGVLPPALRALTLVVTARLCSAECGCDRLFKSICDDVAKEGRAADAVHGLLYGVTAADRLIRVVEHYPAAAARCYASRILALQAAPPSEVSVAINTHRFVVSSIDGGLEEQPRRQRVEGRR